MCLRCTVWFSSSHKVYACHILRGRTELFSQYFPEMTRDNGFVLCLEPNVKKKKKARHFRGTFSEISQENTYSTHRKPALGQYRNACLFRVMAGDKKSHVPPLHLLLWSLAIEILPQQVTDKYCPFAIREKKHCMLILKCKLSIKNMSSRWGTCGGTK